MLWVDICNCMHCDISLLISDDAHENSNEWIHYAVDAKHYQYMYFVSWIYSRELLGNLYASQQTLIKNDFSRQLWIIIHIYFRCDTNL